MPQVDDDAPLEHRPPPPPLTTSKHRTVDKSTVANGALNRPDHLHPRGASSLISPRWTTPLGTAGASRFTNLGPILVVYITDATGPPTLPRAAVQSLVTGTPYSVGACVPQH